MPRPLSYVEIDAEALRYNVRRLQTLVRAGAQLVAVVKGNAYGHGLSEVVRALDGEVDAFQVDDIEELREVRRLSAARVLVLGFVPRASLREAIELRGELALYDVERIPALVEAGRELDLEPLVHLKADALLGRQGVPMGELEPFFRTVAEAGLRPRSVYGHFANIEDTTDLTHAQAQMEALDEALTMARRWWPELGHHVSATSGLLTVERDGELVRLGIGVYGLYPSAALARTHADLGLRPVLRWVSHLAQVKLLPAGHPVGYGLTYVTSRPTRVGIVPQGYADGYDRGLSNSGEVLVRGRRCPVIGRVAMNMFAVDVSAVPEAGAEEEVVLLGAQGEERISAEEIAARLGTIPYEVVSRVSPLIPRMYSA
jgi:alanine racemase